MAGILNGVLFGTNGTMKRAVAYGFDTTPDKLSTPQVGCEKRGGGKVEMYMCMCVCLCLRVYVLMLACAYTCIEVCFFHSRPVPHCDASPLPFAPCPSSSPSAPRFSSLL